MSGGRKIDDHGSWIGKGSKGMVLPMGCKTKEEKSADGAGAAGRYPDTTDKIKADQDRSEKLMKSQKMKDGFRY